MQHVWVLQVGMWHVLITVRCHPITDKLMNLLFKLDIKSAEQYLDESYRQFEAAYSDCPCCDQNGFDNDDPEKEHW